MRHVTEKKDHFTIHKESEFDTKSIKKSSDLQEYSSKTVERLNIKQLKDLMKKLEWMD